MYTANTIRASRYLSGGGVTFAISACSKRAEGESISLRLGVSGRSSTHATLHSLCCCYWRPHSLQCNHLAYVTLSFAQLFIISQNLKLVWRLLKLKCVHVCVKDISTYNVESVILLNSSSALMNFITQQRYKLLNYNLSRIPKVGWSIS